MKRREKKREKKKRERERRERRRKLRNHGAASDAVERNDDGVKGRQKGK